MRAWYSVIRYVPDVGRGEFVNVGIVVMVEPQDNAGVPGFMTRIVTDAARVRSVFGVILPDDNLREAMESHLEWMQTETVDVASFTQWCAARHYSLQFREPMPMVLAADRQKSFDRLWDSMVAWPPPRWSQS